MQSLQWPRSLPHGSLGNTRVFAASAPLAARAAAAASAPTATSTERKRPPSAYNLFVSQRYPELKAKDSSTTLGSMAPLWKSASASDKSSFEGQAADLKAQYNASKPPVQPKAKAQVQAKPKVKASSPANGYSLFMKENFPAAKAKTPDAPLGEVSKAVAAMWKTADKKRYNDQAAEAKAAWAAANPQPDKPPREPKAARRAGPAKLSAYTNFVKANAGEEARVESDETVFKRLGRRWKALPQAEKDKWASS